MWKAVAIVAALLSPTYASADVPELVNSDELQAKLSGNTIQLVTEGRDAYLYIARNGKFYESRDWPGPSGSSASGDWFVSMDSICLRAPDAGEDCYSLFRSGNLLSITHGLDSRNAPPMKILPGDPQHLGPTVTQAEAAAPAFGPKGVSDIYWSTVAPVRWIAGNGGCQAYIESPDDSDTDSHFQISWSGSCDNDHKLVGEGDLTISSGDYVGDTLSFTTANFAVFDNGYFVFPNSRMDEVQESIHAEVDACVALLPRVTITVPDGWDLKYAPLANIVLGLGAMEFWKHCPRARDLSGNDSLLLDIERSGDRVVDAELIHSDAGQDRAYRIVNYSNRDEQKLVDSMSAAWSQHQQQQIALQEEAKRKAEEQQRQAEEQQRQIEEAKRKQERDADNAKAEQVRKAFYDTVASAGFPEMSQVSFAALMANPFVYKGKGVQYSGRFEQMTAEHSALVTIGGSPMIVEDVPDGAFLQPGAIVIAGSVQGNAPFIMLGTSLSVPVIAYLDSYFCAEDGCTDFFGKEQ
jgi:hypothetical protein